MGLQPPIQAKVGTQSLLRDDVGQEMDLKREATRTSVVCRSSTKQAYFSSNLKNPMEGIHDGPLCGHFG